MPTCFVHGCKSSDFKNRKAKPEDKRSLFHPATDEILQAWRRAIPNGEKLEKKNVVCDLHFSKNEIINTYNQGGIMKTVRAHLKKGAVPSIFQIDVRNQKERPAIKSRKTINVFNENCSSNKSIGQESNFTTIMNKFHSIPTPSPLWIVNSIGNFIVWNCWSADCLYSLRKVLLYPDMKIKIFIKDKEIHIPALQSVKNLDEIIQLLQRVHRFLPCLESDLKRSTDCAGHVLEKEKEKKGHQIQFCKACNKLRIATRKKNKSDKS